MTGSGKTGLCLALLEEAAIDGIPAIAIDPKGDLGNLLLTFPELRPEDFRAVDRSGGGGARAGRRRTSCAQTAPSAGARGSRTGARTASASRASRARPSSRSTRRAARAGRPLAAAALVRRAAAGAARRRRGAARARRRRAVVGPARAARRRRRSAAAAASTSCSRTLLERAWRAGRDLDLAALIRADPEAAVRARRRARPRVVLPGEGAHGARDARSTTCSRRRASRRWLEGEPLDVAAPALHAGGQAAPRRSLSIAHLSRRASACSS